MTTDFLELSIPVSRCRGLQGLAWPSAVTIHLWFIMISVNIAVRLSAFLKYGPIKPVAAGDLMSYQPETVIYGERCCVFHLRHR